MNTSSGSDRELMLLRAVLGCFRAPHRFNLVNQPVISAQMRRRRPSLKTGSISALAHRVARGVTLQQLVDRANQLILGFVKPSAAAVIDNLAQAADVMRDDRGPMRERFNRNQAERLFEERRYDAGACVKVERRQSGLRNMAEKVDAGIAGRELL